MCQIITIMKYFVKLPLWKIQRKLQKIQMKSDHFSYFRCTMLKWTIDNFGAGGWIVEVRREFLNPYWHTVFLSYTLYHMSYMTVRYDKYVENNICQYGCQHFRWDLTIQPSPPKLSKTHINILNMKYKKWSDTASRPNIWIIR